MELENYSSSLPVLLLTISTLILKHAQVKTPFIIHTTYNTKKM